MRHGLVIAAALAAVAAAVGTRSINRSMIATAPPRTPSSEASVQPERQASIGSGPEPARFVGSAACARCHRAQSQAYAGSHHAGALTTPGSEDLAHFDGRHFRSNLGKNTVFSLRNGRPQVTLETADGASRSFPIAYVSGVWPLQQYVVAVEHGRLQSLGVVWDSRSRAEGGNRWFHVYGPAGIAARDPLFWTSNAQSFNHVCADCHATGVERRYDAATDGFDTRWAELTIGCEACHGPGSAHVRSAETGGPVLAFAAKLTASEPWTPSPSGSPTPRPQTGSEVEVCAPCHSRRKPIKEGFLAGDAFLDFFEPELLRPGRYHADGQVEGEVYEWGSFLQSRMYHAGVRCSDCHDPHSGQLHAPGNALCVRCHAPARFDVEGHSHHGSGASPRCIDCHMPASTFMQIDERRDHSIRIPRPDRSAAQGGPNACNQCHANQTAAWAADAVARWSPTLAQRPHFGDALALDRKAALGAPRALLGLTQDQKLPAIARATALERLARYPSSKNLAELRAALASSEPLIAYGAALGAAELPPAMRLPLLLPALSHRLRAVRTAAGRGLAFVKLDEAPAGSRAALERAFAEVEQGFDVSASQPETLVERSAFELAQGKLEAAETSLRRALRARPCLTEAQLNLAELERQRGGEAAAGRTIGEALGCNAQSAAAHYALGLWQARARKLPAALESLGKAAALAPSEPRFSYALAVALADAGELERAITVLDASLEHQPADATNLQALARFLTAAGYRERAADVQRRLEQLRSQ